MIERSGVTGGLVVHVGCEDGDIAAALAADERFLVQGLDTEPAVVQKARSRHLRLNLYFRTFDGKTLAYGDSILNVLVVSGDFGGKVKGVFFGCPCKNSA